MRIEVNLTSRQVCTFDLPMEKPRDLLNQLKPRDFFHRPLHQFLGKAMSVSVNPQVVEWMLLDTQELPDTRPLNRSVIIRQTSQEAFQGQSIDQESGLTSFEQNRTAVTVYGKAIFTSGRVLFFEIQAELDRTADRMDLSQKIFEMPALFVQGEVGGLLIVNPENIAVWQVVPGLRTSGRFALHGELIEVSTAGNT